MDLCGQNKKWHASAIFAKSAFFHLFNFSYIVLLWKSLSKLFVSVFQHVYMQ